MVELIGTAMLSLAFVVAAADGASDAVAPVAYAATLVCLTYAGGHISGAHFNPAVTMAVLVRGKLALSEALAYVLVQLIGGFGGAAAALMFRAGGSWTTAKEDAVGLPWVAAARASDLHAWVADTICAFAICHTVLHVTTTSVQDGNSYFGLAIASSYVGLAIALGDVGGGSAANPAVAMLFLVRPSMDALTLTRAQGFVVDADALRDAFGRLSLPIGAPLGGGLLAGALFRTTHPNRFEGAAKGAQEALAPYVIELVGTCLLAFTVATATSSSADNRSSLRGEILAPMSIGAVLTSQVYAGAATSGAHYNPAITIAVSLRRALAYWESSLLVPPQVGLLYIVMQLLGAACGGGLARLVVSHVGHPFAAVDSRLAFAAETLATFVVCLVVLQTATVARMAHREHFGLAIGSAVAAMTFVMAQISGAALNPALGLLGGLPYPWYYVAGPCSGGVLAALFFRVISVDSFAAYESRGGSSML